MESSTLPRDTRSVAPITRTAAFVVAALTVVGGLGCSEGEQTTSPASAARIEKFELQPMPAAQRRECQQDASLAEGISCPKVFPRPSGPRDGDWYIKPVKRGPGRDAPRTGIDISFLPEAEPAIIHFSVSAAPRRSALVGYGEELPDTAREETLGGRGGIYAAATGQAPCCNHAIFVWREAARIYAASLHTIGPGTKPLLERMVERLELPGRRS